ncbi:MAG: putative baseplate assembly protein [Ilumatobacteraceae bacterium]
MALPTPRLDDRSFQDLVDEAKRYVQRRCPEWTDHNVSDPGVTLIETFASMTDVLLYRLNRVPDRHYVKFLELIGVQLFPPTAANVDVTFWLSAPATEPLRVREHTEVATVRTAEDEPINFTTTRDMVIVPTSVAHVASQHVDDDLVRHHDEALAGGQPFFCFDESPSPGDRFLIGLDTAAPDTAVLLRFACDIEGIGVDPTNPPLAWEAWNGDGWSECDLESDTTGGLNRAGDVVLHLPDDHEVSVVDGNRSGWIRARVTESFDTQPEYSASPRILALEVMSVGGTAPAVHARTVENETLGVSEGVPGQRFVLDHAPVVPGQEVVVEVSSDDGWVDWRSVTDFADSEPDSRHFQLDAHSGEIVFGPMVRLPDGGVRQYGAVPPTGSTIRVERYRTGGGRKANVAAGAIRILRTPIPTVNRVTNRRSAAGGLDGEDLENAKVRGPITLRTRNRAVTVEDYEQLARRRTRDHAGSRRARRRVERGAGARRARRRRRRGRPTPLRTTHPRRRLAGTHRDVPRRSPHDRRPSRRRAASLSRRDRRRPGARPTSLRTRSVARRLHAGALRVPPPDAWRTRRRRLAVRPTGPRGRGVRGPAAPAGDRHHRGRPPVRGRPRHR